MIKPLGDRIEHRLGELGMCQDNGGHQKMARPQNGRAGGIPSLMIKRRI